MGRIVSVVLFLVVVVATGASASQRNYVWTEEYDTLGKGNAEVEFYKTAVTPDLKSHQPADWTQQIEVEYGITNHLNASLYEVYEQPGDSAALSYTGYKFELKYRIAERNVLPVDVLLYAEHETNTPAGSAFEGKLVLAKDIGKTNISYNQIYELKYSTGAGEHEYAAGISYEVVPWLRIGIESKGSYSESEYAAGPTLSWMGNRIWANIGALYGLNNRTNDQEVRFILGVPF
jgi:hypothetical protein